jgi:hypothetical protein
MFGDVEKSGAARLPKGMNARVGVGGKENITTTNSNISRPATAITTMDCPKSRRDIQQKPSNDARANSEVRHFSERSDGDLMLNFSRCEIAPSMTADAANASPFFAQTCDTSTSPFDMIKLQAALEAAASDDDEICDTQCGEDDLYRALFQPDKNDSSPPLDYNATHANLEAFKELLYTVEIEEELLHRELAGKSLLRQSETHSDACSVRENSSVSDANDGDEALPIMIPRERQEEIRNYIWCNKMASTDREKGLVKDGNLRFHEIVRM